MSRLKGKIALVTGAARGIGAACGRALRRHGATVVLSDIRDDPVPDRDPQSGVRWEHLDVRRESDWERVISQVLQREARLDILINNAGVTGFDPYVGPHDPENAALEHWRAVHETNLDGVFLGCKHAIRAMKPPAGGGSIVNISSRSGMIGIPGAAAYASSKAAVRNHTKTVALYCAEKRYGIRCNAVLPGAILTPMWDPMLGEGEGRQRAMDDLAAEVPLGRMGSPEEIAELIVFLASDESSYMTGAEFVIDGGILAGAAATPKRGS